MLALNAALGNGSQVVPSEQRKPLWLIPNLLSLDAPLVAVAWLYIFAKTWRVQYLPWIAYLALGLVVWIIYVVDRLLGATVNEGNFEKLEARHLFHKKHQRVFRVLVGLAAFVTTALVISGMPVSIYSYAAVGGILVAGFFSLSLFSPAHSDDLPYGKNILAGLAFAYGTSIIAYVYTSFEFWELLLSEELLCFAVLCILNIFAIDLWEHSSKASDLDTKASDEIALTLPLLLLGAAALIFAWKDNEMTTRPFFYAILTGAASLYVLNRTRSRFEKEQLRVLADVALLIPFVIFLAASQS